MAVDEADALERREHYLGVAGPKDWSDLEVARWLHAVCLQWAGEAMTDRRAAEVLPIDNDDVDGLSTVECSALAAAMYVCWSGALDWPIHRIAVAFGFSRDMAETVINTTAGTVLADPAVRSGIQELSLALREVMLERARGRVVVINETPAEFKAWGPDAA